MRRPSRSLRLWLASLCGQALLATGSAAAGEPAVAEISVSELMQDPVLLAPQISPDGRWVVAIHSRGSDQRIVLFNLESGERTILLTVPDPKALIAWVDWASDEQLLVSVDHPIEDLRAPNARGHWLFLLDRKGGKFKRLIIPSKPMEPTSDRSLGPVWSEQFEDQLVHLLPDDPQSVLLEAHGGVYRLHLARGTARRIVEPMNGIGGGLGLGLGAWLADSTGVVRLGYGWRDFRIKVVARTNENSGFKQISNLRYDEAGGFRPLMPAPAPELIYVMRRSQSGFDEIWTFDVVASELRERVAAHERYDVADLVVDRRSNEVLGYELVTDRPQVHYFRPDLEARQRGFDAALSDRVNRTLSRSRDGSVSLLESSSDVDPPSYFIYRAQGKTLSPLFDAYPELEGRRLSPLQPIRFVARDGLELEGYLTLPGATAPGERLPLVVHPHGGPGSRDHVEFAPEVQMLASRGYAVLQVNFRGSRGYGRAFEERGYRDWGGRMQDDLEDGVLHLVAKGLVDPGRVALYGAGYGGYAALMGLVKTPDRYRCGASYAGVSDILALLADHQAFVDAPSMEEVTIGDRREDREMLEQRSPLRNAESIRVPVLLGHGTGDPIVRVEQSQRMARALEELGRDVTLRVYEDEIHGLRSQANRQAFAADLVAFLDRCLAPPGATAPGP